MFYLLAGLLFGLLVPYISRRFSKFMPATPAYALYRVFKPNKRSKKSCQKYENLLKAYRMRSLLYGVINALLSYLIALKFGGVQTCFWLLFVWILVLLSEIDIKMQLLPDILTVPLLVFGFLFAASFNVYVDPLNSAIGSIFGYFMPVLAAILMLSYSKDAFGGGEIKLMTAMGAWLGVNGLLYATITACFLFGIFALIKGIKMGAFGPALSLSGILVLLFFM